MGKIITPNINKNKVTPEEMKLPTWRKLHFKVSHIIGIIVLLLATVFFGRVAIWEHAYLNRMEGSERATSSLNTNTEGMDEEVDKTIPTETEISEYTVAADRPRYLNIPSIKLDRARIT